MASQEVHFPTPIHNVAPIWRDNSVLIMAKQAQLPERCVKCNAPTQHTLKRDLRWHHPALYLLLFAGVLFYVILALVLSKTATINVGVCETHAAARKRGILIGWGLVLLSFASFYLAVVNEEMISLFIGMSLFLGGLIYGMVKARVVAPQKIDDQYLWLTGLNTDYLQQFPPWHATRQ